MIPFLVLNNNNNNSNNKFCKTKVQKIRIKIARKTVITTNKQELTTIINTQIKINYFLKI
jgi:hypothetical protein